MLDSFGRRIDYLRISITDRCNLRCRYCMPEDVEFVSHEEILRYEEILRICRLAGELGIRHYKVTGGEPLVREGAVEFVRALKGLSDENTVTLTTNGVLLKDHVDGLKDVGIDGINISLDTRDREEYARITGRDLLGRVEEGISACLEAGIRTKINCVLLAGHEKQVLSVADYARTDPIDVRFIELMPIGAGKQGNGLSPERARGILLERYPDLHVVEEKRGYGPAYYEASGGLKGRIGWIDAVSHKFCASCNRLRLTSTGLLKPCLCYGEVIDLRGILRSGGGRREVCGKDESEDKRPLGDGGILEALRKGIMGKPKAHCFSDAEQVSEKRIMAKIGG